MIGTLGFGDDVIVAVALHKLLVFHIVTSMLSFSTPHTLDKFGRSDRTERRCPGEWPERGVTEVTSPISK